MVNYGLEIQGVYMTLFAREALDGSCKMSLRGIPGHPVDGIAAHFGGGGHALAAGVTMREGTLEECVSRVLEQMLQSI